jgi:hypothetical protein
MKHLLPLLLILPFLSCSKPPVQVSEGAGVAPGAALPDTPPAEYGQFPLALLQSGENPLWFELGENDPVLIPSPEDASLCPFVPWPLARRSMGILSGKGQGQERIILGINREGFLVFMPWAGRTDAGIALYRIDNHEYWQHYSVESLFFFDDTPAAMIYRNDYFIDNSLPPPAHRVWGLRPGIGIGELEIPAFEELPPEEGWDLEDLQEGPDGRWYYRAVKKEGKSRGVGYFRTPALSHAGEPSSQWALQNASQPRTPEQAPVPLRQVLEAVGAGFHIAGVVSPEFPSLRYYAAPSAMKNIRELQIYPGYYHNGSTDGHAAALVISPKGQGFIGLSERAGDNVPLIQTFTLPPLPQGFVYTGAALLALDPSSGGPSLAVLGTWEEQDGWNVGAAGFVVAGVHALY